MAKRSPHIIAVGNGAHATGAPRSLLALLEHRPTSVRADVLLIGGGPLVDAYREASDCLRVIPGPSTRGLNMRRLTEELRLAVNTWGATAGEATSILLVNSSEHEAGLGRAAVWPGPVRVIIREPFSWLSGFRGMVRRLLLLAIVKRGGRLACVGTQQAGQWSSALRCQVDRFDNIVARAIPSVVPATGDEIRFLVAGGGLVKGEDLAEEAFQRMRQRDLARLVILGARIGRREDAKILRLGRVEDLPSKLERYGDVLLGLSRSEPFGRTVVEAALAGMGTIAWDHDGYRDTVLRLSGVMVRPFDTVALAREMDRVVSDIRHPFRTDQTRIRRLALENFDPERAARRWWNWVLGQ